MEELLQEDLLQIEPAEQVVFEGFLVPIAAAYHFHEQRRINTVLRRVAKKHDSLLWLCAGREKVHESDHGDELLRHFVPFRCREWFRHHQSDSRMERVLTAFDQYESYYAELHDNRRYFLFDLAKAAALSALDDHARHPVQYAARLLAYREARRDLLRSSFKRRVVAEYFELAKQEIPASMILAGHVLPMIAAIEGKSLEELAVARPVPEGVRQLAVAYENTCQFLDKVVLPAPDAHYAVEAAVERYYARELEMLYPRSSSSSAARSSRVRAPRARTGCAALRR